MVYLAVTFSWRLCALVEGEKMDFEARVVRFPLPLPLEHMSPKFYFTSVNLGVFSRTMNLLFIVSTILSRASVLLQVC